MCRRSFGFLAVLLVALACMPLSAESSSLASTEPFVDSVIYPVPGTLLNLWRTASILQDEALLKADEALQKSQESFKTFKSLVVRDEILGGTVLVIVSVLVGHLLLK
jgi:hypothetical protein